MHERARRGQSEAGAKPGLEVARVVAVHGLKGALKVVPHWNGSTALFDTTEITLTLPSGERREELIESCVNGGKTLLLKLAGTDTREQAEALRGARIEVSREVLAGSDSDPPFLVDLIGAEVEGPEGPLGRVVDLVINPTVDSVIVERPDGSRVEVLLRSEFLAAISAERIVLASSEAILGS